MSQESSWTKKDVLVFSNQDPIIKFCLNYSMLFTSYIFFPADAEFSDEVSNKISND